jgi:hypothetical protein
MDKQMTMEEIKITGLNVLYKKLGAVNYIKFLQQFTNGMGDFTEERKKFIDKKDVSSLIGEIKNKRKR